MTEAKWKFTRILGLTCCVGVLAAGIATRADAEKPKAQKKVSFQTASPTAENIQASVETSLDTAKGATRYISSGHNACEGRIPIFNGLTPFNTTMATTDGPPEPACTGGAGPTNDIWYNYTADFTGDINVTAGCASVACACCARCPDIAGTLVENELVPEEWSWTGTEVSNSQSNFANGDF